MKTKKFERRRLALSKRTITNLDNVQLAHIKGGETDTEFTCQTYCFTCNSTCPVFSCKFLCEPGIEY